MSSNQLLIVPGQKIVQYNTFGKRVGISRKVFKIPESVTSCLCTVFNAHRPRINVIIAEQQENTQQYFQVVSVGSALLKRES